MSKHVEDVKNWKKVY